MENFINNVAIQESLGLTLILSGNIRGQQLEDLRPFWQGFIELQSRIPSKKVVTQIVVHSWNPDLADLVRIVYAPVVEQHENQDNFPWDSIQPPTAVGCFDYSNYFNKSFFQDKSLRPILLGIYSRALAVRLIELLPKRGKQVLLSYWDAGTLGDKTAQRLIIDISLPEEFLYLHYSSDIDKGYPDSWLLAPLDIARQFGKFDNFVLDALASQNEYLKILNQSRRPNFWDKFSHAFDTVNSTKRKYQDKVLKITKDYVESLNIDGFFPAIIRRFLRLIQRSLAQTCITAENSCLTNSNRIKQLFPKTLKLESSTLIKYFVYSKGLRDRVRFLDETDFENSLESGQLINPQPIIIIFYSEVDVDMDIELSNLITKSPLPLAGIYQITDGFVKEYLFSGNGEWDARSINTLAGSLRNQILATLKFAENKFSISLPALLLPTMNHYLECTNRFYLNALMKYIVWRKLDYVALNFNQQGQEAIDFPDLYMLSNKICPTLSAAGTINGLHSFFDALSVEIIKNNIEQYRSVKEFPAICCDPKLFGGDR